MIRWKRIGFGSCQKTLSSPLGTCVPWLLGEPIVPLKLI